MCGIAGIVGYAPGDVRLEELQAMCAALHARGPDEKGFYLGEGAGLGIRRLNIIDLETGSQPIKNEDESVVVVMNGEIYNYRELKTELEGRGHRFRTRSDTETIVHLYEDYGIDCVRKLRGMFGFAIWDRDRRTLHLARDRLGIKPLYYGQFSGRFVFASELKAILQLPSVPRNINWDSLSYLVSSLTTPATESIVQGVHKLESASTLTLAPGQPPRTGRYWSPVFEPDTTHGETWFVERLRELLEESVTMHGMSDVPIGAFLSGGLDSSAVVAMMARASDRPIKTFSIGFSEQAYNESEHARIVAKHCGTEHHEFRLEPDIVGLTEEIAWHLDEPFGDSSALPTYAVSKLASNEVKVALSGDGGDELFAGYDKYAVEERERRRDRIPASLRAICGQIGARMPEGAKGRNFLRHLALTGTDRYLDAGPRGRERREKLFRPEALEQMSDSDPTASAREILDRGPTHWLSSLQNLDLHRYLPLDILTKVDRMSMAHSLETRVPLLDHKLVEFAASIPPDLQRKNGESKHIFKAAMRGILPDEIIDRKKHGFAVPLGTWFRGELDSFVHDLLLSETSRQRAIFNPQYIEKLLALHAGGRNLDLQLWTLISFELWCRTFLDAPAGAPYGLRGGLVEASDQHSHPQQTIASRLSRGGAG